MLLRRYRSHRENLVASCAHPVKGIVAAYIDILEGAASLALLNDA